MLQSTSFPLSLTSYHFHNVCGSGQLSRYSSLLRAGRSGDQILVKARFSALVLTGPGARPPTLLQNWYRVIPGAKVAGAWRYHPPHLAPKLEKEQSYTSTPTGLRGLFQGGLHLLLFHNAECRIETKQLLALLNNTKANPLPLPAGLKQPVQFGPRKGVWGIWRQQLLSQTFLGLIETNGIRVSGGNFSNCIIG